jgi:hypothetical protein
MAPIYLAANTTGMTRAIPPMCATFATFNGCVTCVLACIARSARSRTGNLTQFIPYRQIGGAGSLYVGSVPYFRGVAGNTPESERLTPAWLDERRHHPRAGALFFELFDDRSETFDSVGGVRINPDDDVIVPFLMEFTDILYHLIR